MKFAKSILIGTGSLVLAGLILALLAPKAAHAVAATAVQVMNTAAAPAITQDISRQASQIVNLECDFGLNGLTTGLCYRIGDPTHSTFVTLGQNLVITSVTFTPGGALGAFWSIKNVSVSAQAVYFSTDGGRTTQYTFSPGIVFSSPSPYSVSLEASETTTSLTTVYLTGYITAN